MFANTDLISRTNFICAKKMKDQKLVFLKYVFHFLSDRKWNDKIRKTNGPCCVNIWAAERQNLRSENFFFRKKMRNTQKPVS